MQNCEVSQNRRRIGKDNTFKCLYKALLWKYSWSKVNFWMWKWFNEKTACVRGPHLTSVDSNVLFPAMLGTHDVTRREKQWGTSSQTTPGIRHEVTYTDALGARTTAPPINFHSDSSSITSTTVPAPLLLCHDCSLFRNKPEWTNVQFCLSGRVYLLLWVICAFAGREKRAKLTQHNHTKKKKWIAVEQVWFTHRALPHQPDELMWSWFSGHPHEDFSEGVGVRNPVVLIRGEEIHVQ